MTKHNNTMDGQTGKRIVFTLDDQIEKMIHRMARQRKGYTGWPDREKGTPDGQTEKRIHWMARQRK